MENQDPFEPMSNAEMASQLTALAELDSMEQLNVEIRDESGAVVASYREEAPAGGLLDFAWDGRLGDLNQDDAGEEAPRAPAGRYSVKASATVEGGEQPLTTFTAAYVTSALLNGGEGTRLEREGLSPIAPEEVTRIF